MSEVIDIYTNSIRIALSLYDATLHLGITEVSPDGQVQTTDVARVHMSPQQAMALSLLLSKNVEIYGQQFKEIYLPDDLKARLTSSTATPEEPHD